MGIERAEIDLNVLINILKKCKTLLAHECLIYVDLCCLVAPDHMWLVKHLKCGYFE